MQTTPVDQTQTTKKPSKGMKVFGYVFLILLVGMIAIAIFGEKRVDLDHPVTQRFNRDYFAMHHFVTAAITPLVGNGYSADWKDSTLTVKNRTPGGTDYVAKVRLSKETDGTAIIVSSDLADAATASTVGSSTLKLITLAEAKGE